MSVPILAPLNENPYILGCYNIRCKSFHHQIESTFERTFSNCPPVTLDFEQNTIEKMLFPPKVIYSMTCFVRPYVRLSYHVSI